MTKFQELKAKYETLTGKKAPAGTSTDALRHLVTQAERAAKETAELAELLETGQGTPAPVVNPSIKPIQIDEITPKVLASDFKMTPFQVRQVLRKMVKDGQLVKPEGSWVWLANDPALPKVRAALANGPLKKAKAEEAK